MITVFLCDDDKTMTKKYGNMLTQIAKKHQMKLALNTFQSGEQLLFHLSDSPLLADIIYLDVLMSKIDGIETAKKLRNIGCQAQIIFLTSSAEHVFEAFDVLPIQYLIKNHISHKKFEQTFLSAVSRVDEQNEEVFICEANRTQKLIPMKDILFFEILKRVVIVHFDQNKTLSFYMTMENLEKQMLGKGFLRVHRSYLVNMRHITRFNKQNLYLKNAAMIPVGITYMHKVRAAITHYLSNTADQDAVLPQNVTEPDEAAES